MMETGPPTLRKACQNCTAAKRRCQIRLPQCTRCSKKGLECVYDLEPLTALSAETLAISRQNHILVQEFSLHCLFRKLSSVGDDGPRPAIVHMPDDREGIEYVVWALQLTRQNVMKDQPSVFIHPKLHPTKRDNSLTLAIRDVRGDAPNLSPSCEHFQQLLREKHNHVSLGAALLRVQALMLYLLVFMFSNSPQRQESAKPYFTQLASWAEDLEKRAYDITTERLTPWQGWLFGESIRRTILTSHVLTCVFFRQKYETSANKMKMEALPFDGRPGLWLAETPQAWIAAAGTKTGREVSTNLVSWHEFGSSNPSISLDPEGDLFLSMMLVCHNGLSCLKHNGC